MTEKLLRRAGRRRLRGVLGMSELHYVGLLDGAAWTVSPGRDRGLSRGRRILAS